MATFNVSDAAGLTTALGSASGGDEIVLANGSYGSNFNFRDLSYGSYVTVRSENSRQAMFNHTLEIDNCSYLRVQDITVIGTSVGSDTSKIVNIHDSDHVEFTGGEVHGPVDSDYTGWYGIYLQDNTFLKVSDNYVHDVKVGIIFYPCTDWELSGNLVDYTGSDGYKFIGVHDFLIENNSHGGHFFPQPGAHIDFMQFQGAPGSSNGIIRGNVFLAQNVANAQGIFAADTTYDNFLLEQNIVATGQYRGVSIGTGGTNITARNNTTIHIVSAVGSTETEVIGAQTRSGNLMSGESGGGLDGNGDYSVGADDYGTVFQGTIALGLTLEDLRPVPGGVAETYGAYTRLMELLDETPSGPQVLPADGQVTISVTVG